MLFITSITLISGQGSDKVSLETNLPNGIYPYDGKQDVNMTLAKGTGEEYLAKHFPGVAVKVIKI